MKSTVEQLSPTRVRINVEVPFTELEPDFDRAYKELAKTGPAARLPARQGARQAARGAHRQAGDARPGRQRGACPARYSEAVTASEVQPIGQPEIEVTKKEYGQDLTFTAEVDVRPEITLPDLSALKIIVDPIEVSDEDVDTELQNLRARFGTLTGVERPVQDGDFVSIDLSATVDGEDVPEAKTEGLSHEVGSGQLIEGLDDAIIGLKADESKVFTTTLVAGEHADAGGRGHRHRQVGQGTRAARARRRIRATGKRIRHHRRAQGEPRRPGEAGQARPAGRADPRHGARGAARAGRGAAAGEHRAGPGRRHRCTTRSTGSTTTRRSSTRRSRSRAAPARSSTPTPAPTPRRPSRPSC